MPYIRRNREPELTRLLRAENLTMTEIGEALSLSRQTVSRKMKNPDLFTWGEIKKFNSKLHIPASEIMEALNFR